MKAVVYKSILIVLTATLFISFATGCTKVPELPDGTVAKIGNYEISPQEYMFMFCNAYYTYCSNAYNVMILEGYDFSLTPDNQTKTYKEGITWDQYFKDYAFSFFASMLRLYCAGKDAGFEVEESVLEDFANQSLDGEKTLAKKAGLSLTNYLFTSYGPTTTKDVYKEIVKKIKYAMLYADTIYGSTTLSDEEIEQYRIENIKDYYEIDLRVKMYTYSTEDEFNACRDQAYAFKDAVSTPEEFRLKYIESLGEGATDEDDSSFLQNQKLSEIGLESVENWFLDESRKTGDVDIFIGTGRIIVVMFIDCRYVYDYETCKKSAISEETNKIIANLEESYPITDKNSDLINAIANIAYHGE